MIRKSSNQEGTRNISSKKGKTVDTRYSHSEEYNQESLRVICLLRNVFKAELGENRRHDVRTYMLFGLTMRAVLFDSGFVETNPVSKSLNANTNSNVERKWYIPTFYYTLLKIISSGKTESVMIRFQSLGSYCRIYGCLVGGTTVHSVLLDKDSLSLFSTVGWANCERGIVVMKGTNRATKIQPKKEVLKYWKQIKDELVLPLLTDLCEIAGLKTPPCFMGLPDELKFKILESVSAFDLARVSCVSSKLICMASSNELWKPKHDEHFGEVVFVNDDGRTYEERYANAWKNLVDWNEYQFQCMGASYFCYSNIKLTLGCLSHLNG